MLWKSCSSPRKILYITRSSMSELTSEKSGMLMWGPWERPRSWVSRELTNTYKQIAGRRSGTPFAPVCSAGAKIGYRSERVANTEVNPGSRLRGFHHRQRVKSAYHGFALRKLCSFCAERYIYRLTFQCRPGPELGYTTRSPSGRDCVHHSDSYKGFTKVWAHSDSQACS